MKLDLELMTRAEVAQVLKVSVPTLCRWAQEGRGPRVTWLSVSIPRYERRDVLEWIDAKRGESHGD